MSAPIVDMKSIKTATPRTPWARPTVRRIKAGTAEAGSGFNSESSFGS